MKLLSNFKSYKNENFYKIELSFCSLRLETHRWFCRIWDGNWLYKMRREEKEFGEAYGRNKFEAYRKALKDL